MLISHKHKFVFIRNPKTGTKSISKLLSSYETFEHGHYHEWKVPKEFLNYFVFTVVRHPVTRLISAYKNRIYAWHTLGKTFQEKAKNSPSLFVGEPLSFLDYCKENKSSYWENQYKTIAENDVEIKILKFENFLDEIFELPFLQQKNSIEHIGANPIKSKVKIDNFCSEIIKQKYQEDFFKFSYNFNMIF